MGEATYGACFNSSSGFDYLTGVETSESAKLPGEFVQASIPAQKYAVFTHRDHVSKLRETLDATEEYLRSSDIERVEGGANSLSFFERYQNFDPRSGLGSIEIWVPV